MNWLWLSYLILIFGLSSIPGSDTATQAPRHLDKLVHFALYMGLTISFLRNSGLGQKRWGTALGAAVLLAAVVGCLDELYQGMIPGRSRELSDWLADLLGGGSGALLLLKFKRFAPPSEKKRER